MLKSPLLTQFRGRTSEIEGWIREIGGRTPEIQGWISEVGGRISEVGGRISEVGGWISEVEGWISEVGGWILEVEDTISQAEDTISEIEGWISVIPVCLSAGRALNSQLAIDLNKISVTERALKVEARSVLFPFESRRLRHHKVQLTAASRRGYENPAIPPEVPKRRAVGRGGFVRSDHVGL